MQSQELDKNKLAKLLKERYPFGDQDEIGLDYLFGSLISCNVGLVELSNSIDRLINHPTFDYKSKIGCRGYQGQVSTANNRIEFALLALCMTQESYWCWFIEQAGTNYDDLIPDYTKWRAEFKSEINNDEHN